MAATADHLQQARANRDHAAWLLSAKPEDPTAMQWVVTAAFYCALHGIAAHLAARSLRTQSHVERRAIMAQARAGIPSDVYAHYLQLEDWSRQARYQMRPFQEGMVEHTILARYLAKVTRFVGL